MASFPRYADLDRPDHTGLPYVKGVWGPDDQIGMLNNITPEAALAASRLVQTGRRINLDLPLHLPFSILPAGLSERRTAPKQTVYKPNRHGLYSRDDKLDDFFLQGSSQWDGLTHYGDRINGFYNGVPESDVHGGEGTKNGIENVARFGIFTRGILADLPRYFATTGRAWAPTGAGIVSPEDLDGALRWGGARPRQGDVILVRIGWVPAYLAADEAERGRLFEERYSSGLEGGESMWEYLWDARIGAIASDNVAVEIGPRSEGKPSLHWAIGRLGITLGELFIFEELADACAAEKRYEFLFVSKPLNLRGGVGSPPNAMVVW